MILILLNYSPYYTISDIKMPQRRDNAGAVCDSDMGMLFLNRQFLSYRRLLYQKMGQNFARALLVPSEEVQLRRTTSGDVANFRPIRGREIISNSQTHTQTDTESTYCQALLYEQRLQKDNLNNVNEPKNKHILKNKNDTKNKDDLTNEDNIKMKATSKMTMA